MIKSMTGFASLTRDDDRGVLGITIRAVNHRFLDLQVRLPQALASLEPRLRSAVQARVARGRVEVSVSLQPRQVAAPDVELNAEFARALSAVLEQAREQGLVAGTLTPGDLLRMPQALTIRERLPEADRTAESMGDTVEEALHAALDQLEAMRVREGDHLRADLVVRRTQLADLAGRVVAAAEAGRKEFETRLLERARELAGTVPVDHGLVAQEVVRVAHRSDISEEVTRFQGHLAHWDDLSGGAEPCGRKLDFLLQEMNREVNTIGSKADGALVSELVIQVKAELERLREQVQNVE
ncbi:MAG: YicC/YloC family endoribonuclease [Vicinamibacterales bacterium]